MRNQPAPANVVVADPEDDTAAPMDAEYDTDELTELSTDSEPGKRMLNWKNNDN